MALLRAFFEAAHHISFDHFSIFYWHGRSIYVLKSLYIMSTYFYNIYCIVFPFCNIPFRLSFFLLLSLSPALPPLLLFFFPFIFPSLLPPSPLPFSPSLYPSFLLSFLEERRKKLCGELFLMIPHRFKF